MDRWLASDVLGKTFTEVWISNWNISLGVQFIYFLEWSFLVSFDNIYMKSSCLDAAAEIALLPCFHGSIGEIEIPGNVQFLLFVFSFVFFPYSSVGNTQGMSIMFNWISTNLLQLQSKVYELQNLCVVACALKQSDWSWLWLSVTLFLTVTERFSFLDYSTRISALISN